VINIDDLGEVFRDNVEMGNYASKARISEANSPR